MIHDLYQLLALTASTGASDLHITADAPPMIRLKGMLTPLADYTLSGEDTGELIFAVLTEPQRLRFNTDLELDFALQIEGAGRFRGNAHLSKGVLEAAFRHIPDEIPDLATLGHRPAVNEICTRERGLVLVTGITGSGKSTTMAAMLKKISSERSGVIVTIEDPIEYVFSHSRSIVKQREVGRDTTSFAEALRHVLRQDPDVILVGEMRDPETIRAALTAAETGHLVLATLHTIDAPKAVDRIVDAFPGDQQPQIVAQLSSALEAVVSQRLLVRADGKGRVLATEILTANHAVRTAIRERRGEQLVGMIEIGSRDGMHTIDDSLLELFRNGAISAEDAIHQSREREAMESAVGTPPAVAKSRGLFH